MEPSQRRISKAPGDEIRSRQAPEHVEEASENGGVGHPDNVPEQAAAEERLRFQAQLLDAVGQAIVATDLQGRVLYWNRCAVELYGWSAQEVKGRALHEFLISQESFENAQEALSRLRAGEIWSGEFAVRRKDGTPLSVEVVDTPVRDDGGDLVGIVGITTDITQRSRAGARLREAERRLSTLLSNTPAMVYRCLNEPDWPEEYVSDYSAELTGYPASAFMDNPTLFGSLISEKDRQRIWDEVQGAMDRRERFRLRYAIHHKDGGLRLVEELGQGVYDESGSATAVEGLIYDVTERERADGRLREAEERYRTLVERVPAIVYVQEPGEQSRTTYVSPQNETILGYSPEECLADPDHWIKVMHPDDRERVLAEDRRTDETGEPFKAEYRQFAKDGSVVWLRDEATLVRDEAGEPLYWLGVQTDVTESKEAEEAARRNEERLRSLADAAFEGILISDGGEILEANRALTDMLGYALADTVGRSALEFLAPEYRDLVVRQIASGAEDPYEIVGVKKDGTFLDLEVRGRAYSYRGRDARVTAVRDITERKEAERRLREAEKRYRTLVERIPAVTFVDRAEGSEEPLYVSPQVEGIFGYTPEEWMEGRLWRDRLHPDDRERILASDERFEADGGPVDEEYRLLEKDGSVVWVREETVLVRGEEGEPLFVQGILSDTTERKRAEERLHHQAVHDPLTDLPNRRLFVDRLGQALRRTGRRQNRVAVLFMDLDGFKVVNDSLGHEAGDLLLGRVARRLGRCLRPEDTLARFGGDEFVVLLEVEAAADPAEAAVQVAERIADEIGRPFSIEGRQLFVDASIGIAVGEASTKRPEDLLRDADTAMYRAKDEGSGYKVFDPGMHLRAVSRLELMNDLRRAVERDEFVLHYQPIVHLEDGTVRGMEALVRWNHPERGFLNPDEFVPLAEESGLVVPMGEMVLEEACRQAKEWQENNPRTPPPVMSVNLSARQLRRPDLSENVGQALKKTGFDGSCLTLDVTETAYVEVLEESTAALDRLRAMGVKISIDDFGTGYSSLSYLKRLAADALKIDKSFVGGLGTDPEDTAVVRMIVELAHTFGMETIAEGVETAEQAALLGEMGCDRVQGYLFSEPLVAGRAANLLGAVYHRNSPGGC